VRTRIAARDLRIPIHDDAQISMPDTAAAIASVSDSRIGSDEAGRRSPFPCPVLGFAAISGSGKTTLLLRVIPLLRSRGLRVGLIKRAHHSFDTDKPGKDSYELRKAGVLASLCALIAAANIPAQSVAPPVSKLVVGGNVANPSTFGLDDLLRLPVQQVEDARQIRVGGAAMGGGEQVRRMSSSLRDSNFSASANDSGPERIDGRGRR
jgi:hypothetical protein